MVVEKISAIGERHKYRCPSRFGPTQIWTPRSKFASGFGPPGPNPLANMDPRGPNPLADLDPPRGFGPPM